MLDVIKSSAQNKLRQPGDYIGYERVKHGVKITSENQTSQILFYTSSIIRVFQNRGLADTNPYSVIQKPEKVSFSIEENDEVIFLIGEELDVLIQKTPFLISFLDKNGVVINEDDQGLGTQVQGEQITVHKKLQENEKFVGLGEKTGPLNRRGHGYQNWNTDHFAYGVEDDPLYASIPFYIGLHGENSYGIFLDNTYKSHFNFGASNNRFSSFTVDSGDMDYYFFSGDVEKIVESYTWLTGRMSLPPMWSIGYQQCRYSYYPDTEVIDVARKFRDKDIPADVIVLDIHYMERYKIFSWDKERFPYPQQMVDLLKEMGFEVVVIFDPGIKIEEGYAPYQTGKEQDIFLKYPDNTYYEGEVWPGWCHFPDFTLEKARSWWKDMMTSYTSVGIKGFWNDMNEIATWGQMLPENINFELEGGKGTTRKGRNVYGMQMARSTYEGAKASLKGERPFNLTRAGFSGVQRYSAVWTGDNVASDEHMLLGIRLVNSLGLSGVAFSGYDVGGFAGNGKSSLFARWIQVGAFSPFFRGHSMINSHDSEPWSYGEEVEEISANYIRLRYKLMPYIYSLFLEASERGLPICRSLCMYHGSEEVIYEADFENQYYFGKSILVAPLPSQERFAKIYLPEGSWYEFFTDEKIKGSQTLIREYGIEQLPIFIKSSSILTVSGNTGVNSKDLGDTLEIHLYKGEEANSIDYYEDDGLTDNQLAGEFHRRKIIFSPQDNSLELTSAAGTYASKMNKLKIILHGFEASELASWDRGTLGAANYHFVKPISNFDPFEKENRNGLCIKAVKVWTGDYQADEMRFSW